MLTDSLAFNDELEIYTVGNLWPSAAVGNV